MLSTLNGVIGLIGPAGAQLSHGEIALLQAIARTGSVAQAARECGTSYRHAWGQIAGINTWAGRRWVVMERGRGAELSPECLEVLATLAEVDGEIRETMRALSQRVDHALAGINRRHRRGLRWRLSHDLLIEEALKRIHTGGTALSDLKFHGSRHNLQSLANRDCELAGFHVPVTNLRTRIRRLGATIPGLEGHRIVHLMDRKQGLMVAAGNPKRIKGVADLAGRGVRFINRQTNSGSRELLESLLKGQRVDSARIKGYAHEEFTHFAVAAAVASGAADAAFGIEAAARRLALDFVPLVDESYFVAGSRASIESAEAAEMFKWFRSVEAVSLAAKMGGYTPYAKDSVLDFGEKAT